MKVSEPGLWRIRFHIEEHDLLTLPGENVNHLGTVRFRPNALELHWVMMDEAIVLAAASLSGTRLRIDGEAYQGWPGVEVSWEKTILSEGEDPGYGWSCSAYPALERQPPRWITDLLSQHEPEPVRKMRVE